MPSGKVTPRSTQLSGMITSRGSTRANSSRTRMPHVITRELRRAKLAGGDIREG